MPYTTQQWQEILRNAQIKLRTNPRDERAWAAINAATDALKFSDRNPQVASGRDLGGGIENKFNAPGLTDESMAEGASDFSMNLAADAAGSMIPGGPMAPVLGLLRYGAKKLIPPVGRAVLPPFINEFLEGAPKKAPEIPGAGMVQGYEPTGYVSAPKPNPMEIPTFIRTAQDPRAAATAGLPGTNAQGASPSSFRSDADVLQNLRETAQAISGRPEGFQTTSAFPEAAPDVPPAMPRPAAPYTSPETGGTMAPIPQPGIPQRPALGPGTSGYLPPGQYDMPPPQPPPALPPAGGGSPLVTPPPRPPAGFLPPGQPPQMVGGYRPAEPSVIPPEHVAAQPPWDANASVVGRAQELTNLPEVAPSHVAEIQQTGTSPTWKAQAAAEQGITREALEAAGASPAEAQSAMDNIITGKPSSLDIMRKTAERTTPGAWPRPLSQAIEKSHSLQQAGKHGEAAQVLRQAVANVEERAGGVFPKESPLGDVARMHKKWQSLSPQGLQAEIQRWISNGDDQRDPTLFKELLDVFRRMGGENIGDMPSDLIQ